MEKYRRILPRLTKNKGLWQYKQRKAGKIPPGVAEICKK